MCQLHVFFSNPANCANNLAKNWKVPGKFNCLEEHMLSNFLVCFAFNVFKQLKQNKGLKKRGKEAKIRIHYQKKINAIANNQFGLL